MVLEIQEKDNTFRVKWQVNSQGFSTDWIPDTPSNRKSVLEFLRLLRNDKGKRLFTFRELSLLFGGNSRQVASQHLEAFRDYGKVRCGFFSVLSAKRELIFFLLMCLFIRQSESGKSPICGGKCQDGRF